MAKDVGTVGISDHAQVRPSLEVELFMHQILLHCTSMAADLDVEPNGAELNVCCIIWQGLPYFVRCLTY